ncbi:MAG: DinB family protein [Ktedonobacteraceae bacterium]
MTELPSFAMRVSDVFASSVFLTEKLGFTLTEHKPDEDIAYLLDSDGDTLLLAGPAAQENLAVYLAAQHSIARPGESIGFNGGDLEARQADLLSKGINDLQITQNRIGDRILAVKMFDNYTFHYTVPATHAFDDILSMYAHLSAELDGALTGLSEAEMGLALHEDSWSIRQIIHHLADCDILFAERMKVQLSSSGAVMADPHPVGNASVSTGSEYRDRPVRTSVALFRAFHEHILDIVKYVPNAGERSIDGNNGQKSTFSQMVHLIVGHTGEHLDEILEIRRKYGK